jgi:hypothetical protein
MNDRGVLHTQWLRPLWVVLLLAAMGLSCQERKEEPGSDEMPNAAEQVQDNPYSFTWNPNDSTVSGTLPPELAMMENGRPVLVWMWDKRKCHATMNAWLRDEHQIEFFGGRSILLPGYGETYNIGIYSWSSNGMMGSMGALCEPRLASHIDKTPQLHTELHYLAVVSASDPNLVGILELLPADSLSSREPRSIRSYFHELFTIDAKDHLPARPVAFMLCATGDTPKRKVLDLVYDPGDSEQSDTNDPE